MLREVGVKKSTLKNVFSIALVFMLLLSTIWQPALYVHAEQAESTQQIDYKKFITRTAGGVVTTGENSVTLSKMGGDHFTVFNGLNGTISQFTYEADVKIDDGCSAGLLFGMANKSNPSAGTWFAANFDASRKGEGVVDTIRVFRVNGYEVLANKAPHEGLNFDGDLHLKLQVETDGRFTYEIGNKDSSDKTVLTGNIPSWSGGHIGLLSFNSKATFSNIELTSDDPVEDETLPLDNSGGKFETNLENLSYYGGTWTIDDDGVRSQSDGDTFLLTQSSVKDFVYSTDVTFNERRGAASLVFRSTGETGIKNCYIANLEGESGKARLFKFENDEGIDLVGSTTIKLKESDKYNLKVVAVGKHFLYYIDDVLIANTADYTMHGLNMGGQNTAFFDGYFGLLTWNGDVTYQDAYYSEISDSNTPALSSLEVTANGTGEAEEPSQFHDDQYVYIQYVSNDTSSVNIIAEAVNADTGVQVYQVYDKDDREVTGAASVDVGKNLFTIKTSNGKSSLIYRLLVHRRGDPASYYNEDYRGQYHYSVSEGWANDPNGMVYFNGQYHLFYQFYNDTNWGPMHWAHAVSDDMITWEEKPITFYPDEYGAMFSGGAVVDTDNDSGLFGPGGGLVAFITAHGETGEHTKNEMVIAAYSEDGETWTKYDKVLLDWRNDSLYSRDFRDPKVFKYDNTWFMVIAGGPLRIYSSKDLLNWKEESAYPDLHMECPDLYRLQAPDGGHKWVLSRCGREYKIGDFKQVNGKWVFVPDAAYQNTDGIMNFAEDSYAAMTYYREPFDNDPTVIMINWMNSWGYCNEVDDASRNDRFNGTFNLQLEMSLVKVGDKYLLKETPIEGYESLRDAPIELNNAAIKPGENLLEDFNSDCYEIVATFTPDADTTEVGFNVRVGGDQKTVVKYDLKKDELILDRSISGASPNVHFARSYSQPATIERGEDGAVKMNIFVDRASVEVFAHDYTMAGAVQIFPSITSRGLEVFSVGGTSTADIAVYPMDSIWNNSSSESFAVNLDKSNASVVVDNEITLNAWFSPFSTSSDFRWSILDDTVAGISANGAEATITGLKIGKTTVTVESTVNPELKATCEISVRGNSVETNLTGWTANGGEWHPDGDYFYGSHNDNAFYYAIEKAGFGAYTYSADVKIDYGVVNLVFASQNDNPWDGCYAVQLEGTKVRLFDFKGDHTFEQVYMPQAPNDKMYSVSIRVEKDHRIIVTVNGQEYINHLISVDDRKYTGGQFALGIWNASAEFYRIFYKRDIPDKPIIVEPGTPTVTVPAEVETVKAIIKLKNDVGETAYIGVEK